MIETKTWPENGVAPPSRPSSPWYWWVLNDEGIDPTYMVGSSWRGFFWFWRNFCWNFFKYVVGFENRVITVTGPAPVFTPVWYECAPTGTLTGFKWSVIRPCFPFLSYSGTHWLWYIGWMPSGGRLGIKINRHP